MDGCQLYWNRLCRFAQVIVDMCECRQKNNLLEMLTSQTRFLSRIEMSPLRFDKEDNTYGSTALVHFGL